MQRVKASIMPLTTVKTSADTENLGYCIFDFVQQHFTEKFQRYLFAFGVFIPGNTKAAKRYPLEAPWNAACYNTAMIVQRNAEVLQLTIKQVQQQPVDFHF